jgi:hypothetical protein
VTTQDVSERVNDVDGVVRQAKAVLAVALQAYIAISIDGRVKGWTRPPREFSVTPLRSL